MTKSMIETRWYELGLALENLGNDIYRSNEALYLDFWPVIDDIIKEMSEIFISLTDFDEKYSDFLDFCLYNSAQWQS